MNPIELAREKARLNEEIREIEKGQWRGKSGGICLLISTLMVLTGGGAIGGLLYALLA